MGTLISDPPRDWDVIIVSHTIGMLARFSARPGRLPDALKLLDPVPVPLLALGAGELDMHPGVRNLVVEAVELDDHHPPAGAGIDGDQAEPGVVIEQPVLEAAPDLPGGHPPQPVDGRRER